MTKRVHSMNIKKIVLSLMYSMLATMMLWQP